LYSNDEQKIREFLAFFKKGSWEKRLENYLFAEKQGFHIINANFYSPIPFFSDLKSEIFQPKENIHLNWNEKNQIKLLLKLTEYSSEFHQLIKEGTYDLQNTSFSYHDAPIYYCMIRHFKPQKIVEVGAGRSTKISSIASKKNGKTSLTAIDPFVSDSLKKEFLDDVKLIEEPIQSFPLTFFEQLEKNDFLFIDSTHVSKIGSDVNFLILEVLPILKPGVIIHFHDISLPRNYGKEKIFYKLNFWNEQYLLHAFLIGNSDFEILLGNTFFEIKHKEKLLQFYDTNLVPGGQSFWIRKKKKFLKGIF